VGPYLLQAAIASIHAEAPEFGATDWHQIAALYEALQRIDPSPIVALNRAVAIGMRDGPQAGLTNIEATMAKGLDSYHLAHAARADMQRRLGLTVTARTSYQRALELTSQPSERKLLQRRLAELEGT
jgi:RNA polymerase sigma-70 factor (ECF subfamily)